jgi:hypothetical protein
MASIGLRFESSVFRITAPDAADLTWLADFLACGFEPVDASSPSHEAPAALPTVPSPSERGARAGARVHEVELVIDPVAYRDLRARGRTDTGPDLEGFAQDSQPSMLEPWQSSPDVVTVRNRKLPGFYRLFRARAAVEILVGDKTSRYRTTLMRVVRELAMDRVVATGGVLVHGAAVAANQRVIVVSGPKRCGKTTLLLSLLASTDTAYVSNDRCVLRVDADGAFVRGLPTIVSMRKNSLDAFPRLREQLLAIRPEMAAPDTDKVSVGPHELLALLSAKHTSCGAVAAFLFPRVTENRARLSLRRLSTPETLEEFRAGLFRIDAPTLLGHVFATPMTRGKTARELAERAERWVAAHVPCFRIELGGGEPPTAAECRTLLARVLAAPNL